MRYSRLLAVGAAMASVSLAGAASAQTKEEGYSYILDEDGLLGDTLSSPPPILKGGFRPRRILLIRARATFVPEMLKTVESM